MNIASNPVVARLLHWLFEASLVIKGLLTSAESVAGLGLLIAPNVLVARLVYWLTHFEITDQPTDTMASWTLRAVEQFPVSTQHFYGYYLMAHGGLKLAMVFMLWRRILWAYPGSMVVLGGFVAYQIGDFFHTGSPFLLLLSSFDMVMIGLVWQEWRALRAKMIPS
jgi:uncharacterized membrane protein